MAIVILYFLGTMTTLEGQYIIWFKIAKGGIGIPGMENEVVIFGFVPITIVFGTTGMMRESGGTLPGTILQGFAKNFEYL